MKIKWSDELVIQSIQKRNAEGKALNYQDVLKEDEKLTGAARRYFGSWDKAMHAAGFDESEYKRPKNKRENWSPEKVISRLKEHIKNGKEVSPHAVKKYDNKLYSSGVTYFGSWGKVIEHLGIEYADIKKNEEWSREIVVETIKKANRSGADLSDNTVSALSPKLYGAAYNYFGGWSDALVASGIDPNTVNRRANDWSKGKIIELVNNAFNAGVTLDQLSDLGVIRAANILKYFPTYSDLYTAAGIKPDEYSRKFRSGSPVPNNVRFFRQDQGLSQAELGAKVGYSNRWVSLIENHELGLRLDDAIKLAKTLNVSLDDLFPLDDK